MKCIRISAKVPIHAHTCKQISVLLMLSNCMSVVVCYLIHFAHFIQTSEAGKHVFAQQLFTRIYPLNHVRIYKLYTVVFTHIHIYKHTRAHIKHLASRSAKISPLYFIYLSFVCWFIALLLL